MEYQYFKLILHQYTNYIGFKILLQNTSLKYKRFNIQYSNFSTLL